MARAAIAATTETTAHAIDRMLDAGGNTVDIAVACALTATCSEVLMCSLGGSAFIMIDLPGQDPELIDGADVVPGREGNTDGHVRQVHIPYGDGLEMLAGHGSVAVPGALRALELAWKRHGSLPWREVVAPALEVATQGWPFAPISARWLEMTGEHVFREQPASRECFFPEGGAHPAPGELFVAPDLASTLERIQREGADCLYRGELADAFDREMRAHGGLVRRTDLEAYEAVVRRPLQLRSGAYRLSLNPPPATGGAAVAALITMLEATWSPEFSPAERAAWMARAQSELLMLRESVLEDAAFDAESATALLSTEGLSAQIARIQSKGTTHLSVATEDGGAVSISMSMGYGSGVTIPGTGIACNNSGGEPELNPGGFGTLGPGGRLVSNMSPTIARHQDGHVLSFGSPGASRITSCIAQFWARFALEGDAFEPAILAPRMHVERWPEGLRAHIEPGVEPEQLASIAIRHNDTVDMFFGGLMLAARTGRGLEAVADPRRHGVARVA